MMDGRIGFIQLFRHTRFFTYSNISIFCQHVGLWSFSRCRWFQIIVGEKREGVLSNELSNSDEAMVEIPDIEEGADMVMVKPKDALFGHCSKMQRTI